MKNSIKTILAIDASTIACSVAVCNDKEVLQEFQLSPCKHNEVLIEMIDRILKKSSIKRDDIEAIALGSGFDSLMSLRSSISVAEGLSFALGIPIIKVSTMQILAQICFWKKRKKRIIPAWDTREKQFYCGDYLAKDNSYMNKAFDNLTLESGVIKPKKKTSFFFTGNAWKAHKKYIKSFCTCYPEARAIIFIVKKMIKAEQKVL